MSRHPTRAEKDTGESAGRCIQFRVGKTVARPRERALGVCSLNGSDLIPKRFCFRHNKSVRFCSASAHAKRGASINPRIRFMVRITHFDKVLARDRSVSPAGYGLLAPVCSTSEHHAAANGCAFQC